jgi:glutathione S-transferase
MTDGTLFIGNKRYSSWSLRGWLPVRITALEVSETVIPLAGGSTPAVKAATPSGTVPFLRHKGAEIWESLAICDYVAEIMPALWPVDRVARAHARAIAAEMHAGFRELRMGMPMNTARVFSGQGRTPGALADIARIEAIWATTREKFGEGGPFLFGAGFTIADCMFAPVVSRFLTWEPDISTTAKKYCEAVRAFELMETWYREAAEEPPEWQLPKMEAFG